MAPETVRRSPVAKGAACPSAISIPDPFTHVPLTRWPLIPMRIDGPRRLESLGGVPRVTLLPISESFLS